MDTYIYALKDPNTNDIRYIGVSNNLKLRLSQHLGDKSGTPKSRWIQELLAKGLRPEIIELERISADEAAETERKWLEIGKKEGWPLTNSREAGGGCSYNRKTSSLNFFLRFPNEETKTEAEMWAARASYNSLTEYILEAAERFCRFWEEQAGEGDG